MHNYPIPQPDDQQQQQAEEHGYFYGGLAAVEELYRIAKQHFDEQLQARVEQALSLLRQELNDL